MDLWRGIHWLVLPGWLDASEKHRAISSEGNFHETASWGHPAPAPPRFFPRKTASSPNQTPNNVDLRNVNKNKQEKEAFGNLGKQGKEQPSWRHRRAWRSPACYLFIAPEQMRWNCPGEQEIWLARAQQRACSPKREVSCGHHHQRAVTFHSKANEEIGCDGVSPPRRRKASCTPQSLGRWVQVHGSECLFPDTTKSHSKQRALSTWHKWWWPYHRKRSWHQKKNSLQEKQHRLKYCAFK